MKHSEPAASPRQLPREHHKPRAISAHGPRSRNLRLVGGSERSTAGQSQSSSASPQPSLSPAAQASAASAPRPSMGLLALVAATFFVVSGGPYGLEEIVSSHGYGQSLILLCVVPLIWSLPTALLVGELASALPKEGGFYAWTQRALGPFWGVQQAWMSLAMSLFDMAIYPTLLVTYLGRLFPVLSDTTLGTPGWWAGFAMIVLSVYWNIRGSRAVGYVSLVMGAALLLPFVGMMAAMLFGHGAVSNAEALALLTAPAPQAHDGVTGAPLWIGGVMLCMWNYMGWEFASTVASEVERPQRTYPRAMLLTVALVSLCYVLPVLVATKSGLPAAAWSTGSWVEVGRRLGGEPMAWSVGLGGALCGLGMFNVLIMSYSRLPVALSCDGYLPRWLSHRSPRSGAPTYAILVAAVLYAACMGLGFRRLVEIDVMLYGAVLLLEFLALIVLRVREPGLLRPFRIPGGVPALIVLALLPMSLLGAALWFGRYDPGLWGLSSLELGLGVILIGPALYLIVRLVRSRVGGVPSVFTESAALDGSELAAVSAESRAILPAP